MEVPLLEELKKLVNLQAVDSEIFKLEEEYIPPEEKKTKKAKK